MSQKKLSFSLQLPFYKGGQLLVHEVSLLGHLPVFYLRGRLHGDNLVHAQLRASLLRKLLGDDVLPALHRTHEHLLVMHEHDRDIFISCMTIEAN